MQVCESHLLLLLPEDSERNGGGGAGGSTPLHRGQLAKGPLPGRNRDRVPSNLSSTPPPRRLSTPLPAPTLQLTWAAHPSHSPFSLSCRSRCLVGSAEESDGQSAQPGNSCAWPCSQATAPPAHHQLKVHSGCPQPPALGPKGGSVTPVPRGGRATPISPGTSAMTASPQEQHRPNPLNQHS